MFRLTPHSRAAEIDGALVFLDLKNDSYTYLAPEHSAELLPLLFDQDGFDDEDIVTARRSARIEAPIFAELERAGLITIGEEGTCFVPIMYDSVVDEMPRLIGRDRPSIKPGHVWNFLCSVLLARFMLSCLPLHRLVNIVAKRRAWPIKSNSDCTAVEVTEIYRQLRPLLFSRGDRCLLDSLSLINFLRQYGLDATWRFGVRLNPFRAHAWVQNGTTIYDDMAANIHCFTVILEV